MSTRVYVDGLNLYYGALKGTRFKWLDLVKLAGLLLPDGHVVLAATNESAGGGTANKRTDTGDSASG